MVRDAAGLAWVANLGCIDLNPHPVRAGDLDHPDELRVDLDPVPGRGLGADHPGGAGRPGGARGLRADRLAEDVGLARDARLRQDRAPLDVHRGPPGRGGAGPGDRAAGAAGRHLAVVEGGAARRLRRLQPERQGPHGRLGLLGPADPRRAGVGAAGLGRGPGLPARRSSPSTPCPRRYARLGDLGRRASTRRPARSSRCSNWRPRDEAAGLPDAPWPPHFDQAGGRGSRGCSRPSAARRPPRPPRPPALARRAPRRPGKSSRADGRRRSSMPLIEVARAATKDEAMAGPGPVEAAPPGGLGAARARRRPRGLDARALLDLDPDPAQPAQRARGRAAAAGAARGGLRPVGAGAGPAPRSAPAVR